VVGPHHQLGYCEYLAISLLGETDPDDLPGLVLLLALVGDKFLDCQYIISRAILILFSISPASVIHLLCQHIVLSRAVFLYFGSFFHEPAGKASILRTNR
jgi:hypothetical protein